MWVYTLAVWPKGIDRGGFRTLILVIQIALGGSEKDQGLFLDICVPYSDTCAIGHPGSAITGYMNTGNSDY